MGKIWQKITKKISLMVVVGLVGVIVGFGQITYFPPKAGGGGGGGGGAYVNGTGLSLSGNVFSIDSTFTDTRDLSASGIDATCIPTGGSATAFVCNPTTITGPGGAVGKALVGLTDGMRITFRPDVQPSGAATLTISGQGPKRLMNQLQSGNLTMTAGVTTQLIYNQSANTSTVNTSGTAVTQTAGQVFTADMVGQTVRIDGVVYTVGSFTSTTAITLTTSAGTQTGVTLATGAWVPSGVITVIGTTGEITTGSSSTPTLAIPSPFILTSKVVRLPNSTTLPATCTVGDVYIDTDATSGRRWFVCEATNTWVAQGGGGGGLRSIRLPTGGCDPGGAINATNWVAASGGFAGPVCTGSYPIRHAMRSGVNENYAIYFSLPEDYVDGSAMTLTLVGIEVSGQAAAQLVSQARLACLGATGNTTTIAWNAASTNTTAGYGTALGAWQTLSYTGLVATGCVKNGYAALEVQKNTSTYAGVLAFTEPRLSYTATY